MIEVIFFFFIASSSSNHTQPKVVRLVDASWVWTEPHSRRLKLKLTVQKEVFSGTILQQQFVVEFVMAGEQCKDCEHFEAKDTWNAVVQVRQKVTHKKTFLWLEQVILKHNAHVQVSNIINRKEGLDFFFMKKSHARKFVDFLMAVVPMRVQDTKKQISHDAKSNVYNYKFSYSVEIIPVCREDLCCLPPRLVSMLGGVSPLLLVWKISNKVRLLDPLTLKQVDVQPNQFWANPFRAVSSSQQLVLYYVFDVVLTGKREGKFQLAEVQLAREADFGQNDRMFTIMTHLGPQLSPGCYAWGYDTETAQFSDQDMGAWRDGRRSLPSVILVKKAYVSRKQRNTTRHWELQKLEQIDDDDERQTRAQNNAREREMAQFMDELEEDPEFRSTVNLYRVPNAEEILARRLAKPMAEGSGGDSDGDNDDGAEAEDDFPEIEMAELVDKMQQTQLGAALGPQDFVGGGEDE